MTKRSSSKWNRSANQISQAEQDLFGFSFRRGSGEPRYIPESAWLEHGPFALWLVENLQPRTIVELGTHKGFSYFCFCQAVEDNRLASRCFAVDTWQGDEHAGHYEEDVYRSVLFANRPYEPFSTLLRMRFDEALKHFDDGTVDLLHVDGRHFFEDVKEDFESWLPKLSPRAIVLFHDTEGRERGFGVYRYWAELADKWPSFNFVHCGGLGVLFVGKEYPPAIRAFLELVSTPEGAVKVRAIFEERGRAVSQRAQVQELKAGNSSLEARNAILARQLKQVRRRPLPQVVRQVGFKALSAIGRAKRVLPSNVREAAMRKAAELDPKRIDHLLAPEREGRPDGLGAGKKRYRELMRFWDLERSLSKRKLDARAKQLESGPKISILIALAGADARDLEDTIRSLRAQRCRNWELCLAGYSSTDEIVRSAVQRHAASDSRINFTFDGGQASLPALCNAALQLATGRFVLRLEAGDRIDRDGLLDLATAATATPFPHIVYSDEDRIDRSGTRSLPHFKPDWNRELLYAWNYISRPVIIDTSLVRAAGGFRENFATAPDYDVLLRCIARCRDEDIRHVARVLFHRREDDMVVERAGANTGRAWDEGVAALAEHLAEVTGQAVPVSRGSITDSFVAHWPLPDRLPLVSLIIPTRDRLDLLEVAVESILRRTDYPNFEILIVDNASVSGETMEWFRDIAEREPRVRVIRDDRPFNYSALNNAAVARAKGEIIGLVNNDVEVISPGWLSEMVSLAIRPNTGCVGAKLYYPDGRIQHAGVIVGLDGVAGHSHKFFPGDDKGYFNRLKHRQEISAVTGACLLVRKDIFDAVGGLDEVYLGVAFNDVDFCLKVREAGYRNVWTPFAELYHHESPSRGHEDTPAKIARFMKESRYLRLRWKTASWHDPAYNPNLSLATEDFSIRKIAKQEEAGRYIANRFVDEARDLQKSLEQVFRPLKQDVARDPQRLRIIPELRSRSAEPAWPVQSSSIGYSVEKSQLPDLPVHLLVFVAYAGDQRLSDLQLHMIGTYIKAGYAVAVVVNARNYEIFEGYTADARISRDVCFFAVRENFGYDFAAWSHFLDTAGNLDGYASVTFTNDSVMPLSAEAIRATRARIDTTEADVVFLTENDDIRKHGQSYFFSISNSAIKGGALDCLRNLPSYRTKEEVIIHEELTLMDRMLAKSFKVHTLFSTPQDSRIPKNMTIKFWSELIKDGFPFVKVGLFSSKKTKTRTKLISNVERPLRKMAKNHLEERGDAK